jgi:Cof subfamily protein (haloacid dehalogenase superfamily)
VPLPEGLDPSAVQGVFVDLDGTVVHQAELLPTAVGAVAALQATGVPVVVATGRMFASACRFADALDAADPVIRFQGAPVGRRSTHEVLHHEQLDVEHARAIVAAIVETGEHLNVMTADAFYVAEDNAEAQRYAQSARVPVNAVGDLVAWLDQPVTKLVVSGDPARMDALRDELVPRFGDRAFIAKSLPFYLEVAAPGVHKGVGCQVVADLLGLDPERCVAIGDGENDLELIDWAGYGIAVDGGHPALEERADWVAPAIDDDGVPRVLQAIAEARR